MVKIEDAKLNELKAAHSDGVFEGGITFSDENNATHEVEFLYRKPSTADMESFSKSSQRNPVLASQNLVQSLIIYPDPASIIEQVRDYPTACGRFVDEAVSPFFGANVVVRSRKL
jgi:hypothetical protein